MIYDGVLKGKYVELRSADIADAEFTLAIRQDPVMTEYLPPLNINIGQQREWIRRQREKEGDYFFVVKSINTGEKIGTMGIYNIHDKEGEGGRFALYGEVHEKIEAGILMSEFEFDILGLEQVTGWVYCGNSPAVRWNKKFGAVFSDPYEYSDGKDVFDMSISKQNSEAACKKLKKMIEKIHV